jgi:hypothetical protein
VLARVPFFLGAPSSGSATSCTTGVQTDKFSGPDAYRRWEYAQALSDFALSAVNVEAGSWELGAGSWELGNQKISPAYAVNLLAHASEDIAVLTGSTVYNRVF